MGRFIQNPDSNGSLKNLQIAINEKKKYLDYEILKVAENTGDGSLFDIFSLIL